MLFHQLFSILLYKDNEGKPIFPKWKLPFKVSMPIMILGVQLEKFHDVLK